jgi:hypothetical protein
VQNAGISLETLVAIETSLNSFLIDAFEFQMQAGQVLRPADHAPGMNGFADIRS